MPVFITAALIIVLKGLNGRMQSSAEVFFITSPSCVMALFVLTEIEGQRIKKCDSYNFML